MSYFFKVNFENGSLFLSLGSKQLIVDICIFIGNGIYTLKPGNSWYLSIPFIVCDPRNKISTIYRQVSSRMEFSLSLNVSYTFDVFI